MKVKNNLRYYTLFDIVNQYNGGDTLFFTNTDIQNLIEEYIPTNSSTFGLMHNPFTDTILKALFNNIFFRYQSEYVFVIEADRTYDDLTYEEKKELNRMWLSRILDKTIQDEEYYYTLLEFYNNHKSNLLSKIETIQSSTEEVERTGQDITTLDTEALSTVDLESTNDVVNRVNDTPNYQQATAEQYQGFGYTSQIGDQKNNGTQSGTTKIDNTGTTTIDKTSNDNISRSSTSSTDLKYLYEKLFEIQKNYKDLLGDWIKSYRSCFIESYNI